MTEQQQQHDLIRKLNEHQLKLVDEYEMLVALRERGALAEHCHDLQRTIEARLQLVTYLRSLIGDNYDHV